jgi:hypothetical protein
MLHRLHNSLIQAGRLVFLDLVYLATTDAMWPINTFSCRSCLEKREHRQS